MKAYVNLYKHAHIYITLSRQLLFSVVNLVPLAQPSNKDQNMPKLECVYYAATSHHLPGLSSHTELYHLQRVALSSFESLNSRPPLTQAYCSTPCLTFFLSNMANCICMNSWPGQWLSWDLNLRVWILQYCASTVQYLGITKHLKVTDLAPNFFCELSDVCIIVMFKIALCLG